MKISLINLVEFNRLANEFLRESPFFRHTITQYLDTSAPDRSNRHDYPRRLGSSFHAVTHKLAPYTWIEPVTAFNVCKEYHSEFFTKNLPENSPGWPSRHSKRHSEAAFPFQSSIYVRICPWKRVARSDLRWNLIDKVTVIMIQILMRQEYRPTTSPYKFREKVEITSTLLENSIKFTAQTEFKSSLNFPSLISFWIGWQRIKNYVWILFL